MAYARPAHYLKRINSSNYFHSVRLSCAKLGINVIRHNRKILNGFTSPNTPLASATNLFSIKLCSQFASVTLDIAVPNLT